MSFLYYPRPHDTWHDLTRPISGQIQGIPSMRGLAISTNYIHVAIAVGGDLTKLVFGHLEWFVKDKNEPETELDDAITCRKAARAAKQQTKKKKEFAEFDV